jgi:divalent metal cation (Fe/Co/Zn/Cd) transporter
VVLLEDLGALVGLVLALIGVSLAATTGNPDWDAYGTLAIGSLLAVIAIILAVEMQSLLLGEAASPSDISAIRAALESEDGVHHLIELKTQHIGPEEVLVAAKVQLEGELSFRDVVRVIDAAEASVRRVVPMVTEMYIEPDYPFPGLPEPA